MAPARAAPDARLDETVRSAVVARNRGNVQLSIDLLSKAWETADEQALRTRIAGELGASLLQARRFDEAEPLLKQAHEAAAGAGRARSAVALGNLAYARKDNDAARRYYAEAETLAGANLAARLPASLNRARLIADEAERLRALAVLYDPIAAVDSLEARARLYLNLAFQARQLGARGVELAYRSLAQARQFIPRIEPRLGLETLDALAQLYEDQDRMPEALRLTRAALARPGAGDDHDLLFRLEWRRARGALAEGQRQGALAAYQNAARHLEAIRQDLPIDYDDGRSSFQATLKPFYSGLIDLILRANDALPEAQRGESLRSVIAALELTRQSEMQDYLGDRCSVDGVRSDAPSAIPAGSAVIYPVMLPDRLELLFQSEGAILRRSVDVGAATVAQRTKAFARALVRYGSTGYLPAARQLYDWLLRPFEAELAQRKIASVVVVSDGVLRLIPMGALHDGRQFAIERFAISTVTGLSMTDIQAQGKKQPAVLLAGLSEPGPVIDKLSAANTSAILGESADAEAPQERGRGAPQIRSARVRAAQGGITASDPKERAAQLRESLALPGVKEEIDALKGMLKNVSIVDAAFTLGRFTQELASGDYRILHIASHGVFGGSAAASYIMTYDDLLTMDRLEALLNNKKGDAAPIELVTLSACETAEGNERAPLGISGAAIKAKARSVLGTLWPVGDEAARKIMDRFYEGLVQKGYSKSAALQAAQRELLKNEALAHPFYWAPFVLIGNWL